MNSSIDDVPEVREKKSVEKNYRPLPERVGENAQQKLKQQRQANVDAAKRMTDKATAELRDRANVAMAKNQSPQVRAERRKQYSQRLDKRMSEYLCYVPVPENLSPWLNMFLHKELTEEQRLMEYTRRKKCSHGRCYTGYTMLTSIRHDGTTTDVYMKPKCFCHTEKVLPMRVAHDCGHCSAKELNVIRDPTYPGDAVTCLHCKMSWYHSFVNPYWRRVRGDETVPKLAVKHADAVEVQRRKQAWKPTNLDGATISTADIEEEESEYEAGPPSENEFSTEDFPELIPSKQEFGDNIVGALKSFGTTFVDFLTRCKDWVSHKLKSLGLTATAISKAIDTWKELVELSNQLMAGILSQPITFMTQVWGLLQTDSTIMRWMHVLAIFENKIIGNLIHRIGYMLGLGAYLPAFKLAKFHKEDVYSERERVRAQLVERYTDEARDRAAMARDFGSAEAEFQDARETINSPFVMPETLSAEQESGFCILDKLFCLRHFMKGADMMGLIKDFNAVSSGWKNLGEWVQQFIEYLPRWMLKLFTIADPRKRFAVEARKEGTPPYLLVQAYKALLEGNNCASAAANEHFKQAWRDCDKYIVANYPPNESVNRLVKAYWTNAIAIMTPGTLGSKPIPFVLTIFGKPGTGKSASWPLLLSGIIGEKVQNIRSMSYTRDTSSEYFDGYNPEKHPIFVYDDFCSKMDDDAAAELMAIVSNGDFLPPFASLSDLNVGVKGVSFRSPIVVLCTNFEDFSHCKEIADKVALKRRLGFMVKWDERYTGVQTYSLCKHEPDGTTTNMTGDAANGKWTMKALQERLKVEYGVHMAEQIMLCDELNKHISSTPMAAGTFRKLYEDTANSIAKVPAQRELGAFGWGLIVALTYKIADHLDSEPKAILKSIAGIGCAVAALVALGAMMYRSSTQESGETATRAMQPRTVFQRVQAVHESGESNDEGVMNRVLRNHVVLIDQNQRFVNGLFVQGRVLLTVKHFLRNVEYLTIHSSRAQDTAVYEVSMAECRVLEFPDADLALVALPNLVQPYQNIVRYVIPVAYTTTTKGFVTRRQLSNDITTYGVDVHPSKYRLQFTEADGSYTESVCDIHYRFHHRDGDCGNVIFARQNGNLYVVGLHSSGSTRVSDEGMLSFGTMLNMGELKARLAELEKSDPFVGISREMEMPALDAKYEEGVSVNKTQFVTWTNTLIGSSGQTTLRKSMLFDTIQEHVTEPALLYRKGDLDPMMKGLSKFGLSTKQFPRDAVEQAVDSIIEQFSGLVEDGDLRRRLTLDEALNGIPGVVESVDSTTSSGYPFSLHASTRGAKSQLFQGEPGKWTLGPLAKADYMRWHNLLLEGVVPSDPFIATLKDERRKIEKVRAGKTRVFCAGSLSGFLHNKERFAGFCTFLQRVRFETFSTLGLNRGSREWHELISYMKEVGDYGLDGDQEEWDGRFKSQIALCCARIMCWYYGLHPESESYRSMYILFLHAIFPHLHVTWNLDNKLQAFIILVPGCMPSGWYLTFVLNSLVNAVLMRVAWIHLVSAPFNDLAYFRRHVREKYAGDDSFLSVHPAYIDQFNNLTIADFFACYEQKYTSATKDGTLVKMKRVEECTFLKTKTGRLYDLFVPHFDWEANLETLNWIRKTTDPEAATESNCNDVLRNIFFYGKFLFDQQRGWILAQRPRYILISHYALEQAFLGYGTIVDPYGTFTYSRSNPSSVALHRAIQTSASLAKNASNLQGVVRSVKESGNCNSMNSITIISAKQESGRVDGLTVEQPVASVTATPNVTQGDTSTLDDSTPKMTSREGVHLAEQQETVMVRPVDGNARHTDTRAQAHLNESDWTLERMLHRETQVAAFSWALTDSVGTELAWATTAPTTVGDVPADLLRMDIVTNPFLRFIWWRCKTVRVRFQLVASRFHQGRLLAYFWPTMLKKEDVTAAFNALHPTRATQLQHGFLDPSNGTILDFDIPFRYNKGWIDLIFGDSLGQLHVQVLNQLQAATGSSTSVEVKMFVTFDEPHFRVPRPGGVSFRDNQLVAMQKELEKLGFSVVKKVAAKRESGLFSKIGSGVGGALDQVVESIVPAEVTGAIAGVLLDKPAVTEYPPPLVRKEAQYMSASRGIENLERMTFEPSRQDLTTDQFGDSIDEMDMKYLLQKRVYLRTFNWAGTNAVGDVLFSQVVSPRHLMTGTEPVAGTPFNPTTVGFLSNLFTYWRGGLTFIFQVVGTSFHEGRLDFCNHVAQLTPPADYTTALSQYVNSQTIRNTNNTVEVRIPFHSDTPWKRVWNGETLSDTESDSAVRAMDYVTGSFTVRVAVPLKNPNNVASNIDVNVFIAAADDFSFHTLSPWSGIYTLYDKPAPSLEAEEDFSDVSSAAVLVTRKDEVVTRKFPNELGVRGILPPPVRSASNASQRNLVAARKESGDLNTDPKGDSGVISLGLGNVYTHDVRGHHFGETYSNLREMCKRYQYADEVIQNIPANGGPGHIQFLPQDMGGLIGTMMSCYRLFRGPLNFKIEVSAQSATGVPGAKLVGMVTTNPQPALFSTGNISEISRFLAPQSLQRKASVLNCPMVRFSENQVGEFQIPFQSMFHSLLISNEYDDTGTYFGNQYVQVDMLYHLQDHAEQTNAASVTLAIAFGDETRLGVFMGFPRLAKYSTPPYPNPGS